MLVIRDAFSRRPPLRRLPAAARHRAQRAEPTGSRRLVDDGILDQSSAYQERPERFEYRLTEKGLDLFPVLMSLMKWGDRHAPEEAGPPLVVLHRGCGGEIDARLRCAVCGESITALNAEARQPVPSAG